MSDKKTRLWRMPTGSVRPWLMDGKITKKVVLPQDGQVDLLAFSPDGRMVATASGRSARLWDTADGRELARMERRRLAGGR